MQPSVSDLVRFATATRERTGPMSVYAADPQPRRVRFDWINEAFSIFAKNAGVWILSLLIVIGLAALVGGFLGGFSAFAAFRFARPYSSPPFTPGSYPGAYPMYRFPPSVTLTAWLLGNLYGAFFYSGFFKMANKQVRGEAIGVGDLFRGGNVFLPMLLYQIVFGLLLGISALLCLLPAFAASVLLWPGFALIADGESFGGAFSRSVDALKSAWLNACVFGLALFGVHIACLLTCGLGFFVIVPMTFLISALMYRDMIGMPGAGPGSPMAGLPGGYAAPMPGVWPPPPNQGAAPAPNPLAPPISEDD